MLAIVIDTSSAAVTAAIVDFDAPAQDTSARDAPTPVVLAARTTIDARAHAELLAPSIADCLAEAGVAVRDVDAVVAGVGPGPFTGLRVGLVTAAALADAVHLPAYGVCSLDAIAAELAFSGSAAAFGGAGAATVLVAGDARRHEVYWARYTSSVAAPPVATGGAGGLTRIAGPDVARPGDVELTGVAAMAGAGARRYADVLELPLLEPDYPTPRGLALVAAPRVRDRAPSEPLRPLYLRRPDAVAPTSYKAVTP